MFENQCEDEDHTTKLIQNVVRVATNTFLNNYVKRKNNAKNVQKSEAAQTSKRKLETLVKTKTKVTKEVVPTCEKKNDILKIV